MAKIKSVKTSSGKRVQIGSKAYERRVGAGETAVSGTGKNLGKKDISTVAKGTPGFTDEISTTQAKREANAEGQLLPYQENKPVDTTQPSPQTATIQPPNQQAPEQNALVPYEQAQQNLAKGGLTGTALQSAQTNLQNRYAQLHQSLQGTQGTASASEGLSAVRSGLAPEPQTAKVDALYQDGTDPVTAIVQNAYDSYLNATSQKDSLLSDYKKLYKESGLKDINEELIDAETILDGTEDDIRNEIQTAGGFATDSQVQAMTLARNKGMLKRYNQLFAMKQDATQQLNMMLNLSAQDRQMAQQRADSQLSVAFKLADFRQQAQNNIRETFNSLVSRVGYAGAYAAYASNPQQLANIERLMNLTPGGLAQLASQPDYDMLVKQAQYKAALSTIEKNNYEMQKDANKKQVEQQQSATTAQTMLSASKSALNQLSTPITVKGVQVPFTETWGKTGISGNISTFLGKGPGKDLSATLDTMKANIAFDELQKMRNASPTGGAVGNVSDKDLALLSAKRGSLDLGQNPEQLAQNIKTIQADYIDLVERMGYIYDEETGMIITP